MTEATLTPAQYKRARNGGAAMSAMFLLFSTLAYNSVSLDERSDYTLAQDFRKAAVQEQMAPGFNAFIDGTLEKRRLGEGGREITYKIEGTVDFEKVEASLPERFRKHAEEQAGLRTARMMMSAMPLLLAILTGMSALGAHRALKQAEGQNKPPSP